jgi:hypothetical protein
VKPNIPKSEFQQKTFAKLSGLGIVGRSVAQFTSIPTESESMVRTVDQVKQVVEEVFQSSTPSMIRGEQGEKGEKGDKGDPGIPDAVPIKVTVCTITGPQDLILYSKK